MIKQSMRVFSPVIATWCPLETERKKNLERSTERCCHANRARVNHISNTRINEVRENRDCCPIILRGARCVYPRQNNVSRPGKKARTVRHNETRRKFVSNNAHLVIMTLPARLCQ